MENSEGYRDIPSKRAKLNIRINEQSGCGDRKKCISIRIVWEIQQPSLAMGEQGILWRRVWVDGLYSVYIKTFFQELLQITHTIFLNQATLKWKGKRLQDYLNSETDTVLMRDYPYGQDLGSKCAILIWIKIGATKYLRLSWI